MVDDALKPYGSQLRTFGFSEFSKTDQKRYMHETEILEIRFFGFFHILTIPGAKLEFYLEENLKLK